MHSLWVIPALPLAGFLILFLTEGRLPRPIVSIIGAGSVGFAGIATVILAWQFVSTDASSFSSSSWTWMVVGDLDLSFRLWIDELSLVMTCVITGVGFLIHWYATGYMSEDEGYSRFFCYMNLFVFAMLMLVMGDSLLLLFLGWEGVGLCSYLLIGFFHKIPEFGYAARKAFVVTRVGDTFLIIALFLLFREVSTLNIQEGLLFARETWADSSNINTIICLLLLGWGNRQVGTSTVTDWLPDAMAGPTPVSALIHAATMVTAGVYLIARMQDLFLLSPTAMLCVAVVGLITLFIASLTALVQSDIKRVLAYSTMSQIGFMFFALGVGAWSAGIFHLMTHAFFKALLFLASGSVILAMHHEQNMFKMGGLRKKLPIPFYAMVVGSAALVALPFITSGFFSKDAILLTAWKNSEHAFLFWSVAVIAAFLTSLYTVRMIVITFFGKSNSDMHELKRESLWHPNRIRTVVPFCLLAFLSIAGGWLGFEFTGELFHDQGVHAGLHFDPIALLTIVVPLAGVVVGYLLFATDLVDRRQLVKHRVSEWLSKFWGSGWGFDKVYDTLIVHPFRFIAQTRQNRNDVIDLFFKFIKFLANLFHHILSMFQTGHVRWYAFTMLGGLLLVLFAVVWV